MNLYVGSRTFFPMSQFVEAEGEFEVGDEMMIEVGSPEGIKLVTHKIIRVLSPEDEENPYSNPCECCHGHDPMPKESAIESEVVHVEKKAEDLWA